MASKTYSWQGIPADSLPVDERRAWEDARRRGAGTRGSTELPACSGRTGGPAMESRQFDRWTRLFGGASRRDAIKLLITGMTGGLLANGGIRGAMAQVDAAKCKGKGENCNNNNDCCNNLKCNNNNKCE
jgi:hypothetical protein